MIATIELEPFDIIGVPVEAHWDDLPRAVPAAWGDLFRSLPEARRFVEVSLDRRDAVSRRRTSSWISATRRDYRPGGTSFM
jgi:hypothetical protein